MRRLFSLIIITSVLLNFYGFIRINHHLSLIFSVLLFLFMPGYYLTNLLLAREKLGFFERIAFWFTLSLISIILPCLTGYVFGLSQMNIVYTSITVALALMICSCIKNTQWKNKERSAISVFKSKAYSHYPEVILMIAVFISMGFFAYYKISMTADSLTSISLVRKLAESPFIKNYDTFYKNTLDPVTAHNVWYLVIGLLSYLSKTDSIQVWIFLPVVIVPLMFISLYAFSKNLFKNSRIALVCVFLFFVSCGMIEGGWAFINSPDVLYMILFVLSPVALLTTFKYLREGRKLYLILTGLISLAIATFHLYGFGILLASLISFYFFVILFKRYDNILRVRLLKSILSVILLSSPYLFFRFSQFIITEPHVLKNFWIVYLSDKLYYINFAKLIPMPRTYLIDRPISNTIYQASFFLAPLLIFWFKKKDWSIFLFSNMLTPPLIMLNPLLVPILLKISCTEVLVRLSRMMPFLLVTGFFFYLLFAFLVERFKKPFVYSLLYSILIIGFLSNSALNRYSFYFLKEMLLEKDASNRLNYAPKPNTMGYFKDADIFMPALGFIRCNIPVNSVFLADEEFSLFISAYTRNFVVMVNKGYVSIAADDQIEREVCTKKVLDFKDNVQETEFILSRFNVDYVALTPDSINVLDKFRNNKDRFKEIYTSSEIYIFEVKNNEVKTI